MGEGVLPLQPHPWVELGGPEAELAAIDRYQSTAAKAGGRNADRRRGDDRVRDQAHEAFLWIFCSIVSAAARTTFRPR